MIKFNELKIFVWINIFYFNSNIVQGTLPLPRTPVMYAIISLHDHILFIMSIILTIVIYLLFSTLFHYIYSYDNVEKTWANFNKKIIIKFFFGNWFDKTIWVNIFIFLTKFCDIIKSKKMQLKKKYEKILLYFSFNIIPPKNTNSNIVYNKLELIKKSIWDQSQYSWLTLAHNTMLEIYWTIIPCFLLILIAIPSFWLLYAFDEAIDPSVTFRIIGHQWYWSYEMCDFVDLSMHWSWGSFAKQPKIDYDSYLLDISELKIGDLRLLKTTAPLLLPKDLHIRFLVTSDDVLHSFSVPSFGIKIDAVPGRLNQLSIYIKDQGIFFGQCSELCGANHGFMPIEIWVLPFKQYYLTLYNNFISNHKWWYIPKWKWNIDHQNIIQNVSQLDLSNKIEDIYICKKDTKNFIDIRMQWEFLEKNVLPKLTPEERKEYDSTTSKRERRMILEGKYWVLDHLEYLKFEKKLKEHQKLEAIKFEKKYGYKLSRQHLYGHKYKIRIDPKAAFAPVDKQTAINIELQKALNKEKYNSEILTEEIFEKYVVEEYDRAAREDFDIDIFNRPKISEKDMISDHVTAIFEQLTTTYQRILFYLRPNSTLTRIQSLSHKFQLLGTFNDFYDFTKGFVLPYMWPMVNYKDPQLSVYLIASLRTFCSFPVARVLFYMSFVPEGEQLFRWWIENHPLISRYAFLEFLTEMELQSYRWWVNCSIYEKRKFEHFYEYYQLFYAKYIFPERFNTDLPLLKETSNKDEDDSETISDFTSVEEALDYLYDKEGNLYDDTVNINYNKESDDDIYQGYYELNKGYHKLDVTNKWSLYNRIGRFSPKAKELFSIPVVSYRRGYLYKWLKTSEIEIQYQTLFHYKSHHKHSKKVLFHYNFEVKHTPWTWYRYIDLYWPFFQVRLVYYLYKVIFYFTQDVNYKYSNPPLYIYQKSTLYNFNYWLWWEREAKYKSKSTFV